MKTLVIVAGQLRTWNYNYEDLAHFVGESVEKLINFETQKPLFDGEKPDLLLCHWDISYQLYPDYHSFGFLQKEGEDLEKSLNYLRAQSFMGEVFTHQENYLDVHAHFERENFSLPEAYHFAGYLAYQACRVKRKIELQRGSECDLVLLLRPDVFYANVLATHKFPRLPRFGEIYCQDGAMALNIRGMLSTAFQDLIFMMNSPTHNIFSQEIIYHVNSFRKGGDFTTTHFEKSFYLNSRNFTMLNFNGSVCEDAVIVRPTIDAEKYRSLHNREHKKQYLKDIEKDWIRTKDETLDRQVRAKIFNRAFYPEMDRLNLNKIRETLGLCLDVAK